LKHTLATHPSSLSPISQPRYLSNGDQQGSAFTSVSHPQSSLPQQDEVADDEHEDDDEDEYGADFDDLDTDGDDTSNEPSPSLLPQQRPAYSGMPSTTLDDTHDANADDDDHESLDEDGSTDAAPIDPAQFASFNYGHYGGNADTRLGVAAAAAAAGVQVPSSIPRSGSSESSFATHSVHSEHNMAAAQAAAAATSAHVSSRQARVIVEASPSDDEEIQDSLEEDEDGSYDFDENARPPMRAFAPM
jgi:hypothetical protein